MAKSYRVVIIGAGIGGLATAIALRSIGCRVIVYEQATSLRLGGAGLSLWPNAMMALRRLGLERAALDQGVMAGHPRIVDAQGATLVQLPRELAMLGILRAELHSLLTAQLGGVDLRCGHRCIRVEERGTEAVAFFDHGVEVVGDLVVAADGIHSQARSIVAPHGQVQSSGYVAWRGLSDRRELTSAWAEACEVWGGKYRFGYIPVSERQLYWFVTSRSGPPVPMSKDEHVGWLQQQLVGLPSVVRSVIEAAEPASLYFDKLKELIALRRWSRGPVVLLGDAAHAATPNLGQGAGMALEDAVALGDCLEEEDSIASALAAYVRRRRSRTRQIAVASRWLGRVSQPDSLWQASIRDQLLRASPAALGAWVLGRLFSYP